MVRGLCACLLLSSAVAFAQPKLPALVGATELQRFTTPTGFIDDAVAADENRVAYVVADAGTKAELHVVTVATKAEQIVDLSPLTQQPTTLAFVGNRVLVIGKQSDGYIAGLVDLTPKAKKPFVWQTKTVATDISLITRDGRQRLAVHRASGTKHEVEVLAVENGQRSGAVRSLEVDQTGKNEKLGFRVNDWGEGWTRPHGVKAGEWDRRENERAPDFEVTYDLPTGKFVDKKKIEDLFEQRRRFQALAEANGRPDFVRFSWDNTGLQVWKGGKLRAVDLDQPLSNYDTKTLQGVVTANGGAWVVLKADPVNAEAVARKKADPEYLDVFQVAADGKTVARKARVLATGARHRFGVAGATKFWLVERNTGFERGGKSLVTYQLQ